MYIVSLKQFDGPLDLLLTLITHAKVDIHDIFVSEITEQYLESMKLVDELDMDSAQRVFADGGHAPGDQNPRAMLPKPPKPEDEKRAFARGSPHPPAGGIPPVQGNFRAHAGTGKAGARPHHQIAGGIPAAPRR